MLFDPDKLDDNDPRKIAFLKQQEDQRQRAQKQPVDQENSDKVRPNPNAIATITPMKSALNSQHAGRTPYLKRRFSRTC